MHFFWLKVSKHCLKASLFFFSLKKLSFSSLIPYPLPFDDDKAVTVLYNNALTMTEGPKVAHSWATHHLKRGSKYLE